MQPIALIVAVIVFIALIAWFAYRSKTPTAAAVAAAAASATTATTPPATTTTAPPATGSQVTSTTAAAASVKNSSGGISSTASASALPPSTLAIDPVSKYVSSGGHTYTTQISGGTSLNIGDALFSSNKAYVLYLAPSGTKDSTGAPLGMLNVTNVNTGASTPIFKNPVSSCVMQTDGNFVGIINGSGLPSTATQGNAGAYLHLTSTGVLEVVASNASTTLWRNTSTPCPTC